MKKKQKYIIIGSLLILVFVIGFIGYRRKKAAEAKYITAKVEEGDISQVVSATGTVIPPSEINLNNVITGKLVEMKVSIGDKITKDQELAKLDDVDLKIKLSEAQANLTAAQADLSRLLQGAKNEDIAVSVTNADKAETDYKNALKNFDDIKKQAAQDIKSAEDNLSNTKAKTEKDLQTSQELVNSAEITLKTAKQTLENTKKSKEQAITNAKENALTSMDTKLFVASASLNVVYDIINNSEIKNNLSTTNSSYLEEGKLLYGTASQKIAEARASLSNARSTDTKEDIKAALDKTISALNETFNDLLACYNALANSITDSNLSQSSLDAYKASVKAEQNNISTALTTIQANKQTLENSTLDYNSSIDTAQSNISAYASNLDEAKAKLDLAKTSKDTQIKSAENNLIETKIAANKKINDAQTSVDSYYNQWQLMKKQLDLKESSPLSSEISLYQARVKQAEAALASANENLDKTILKAPIDGVITKKNYEIGEQTSLATPIYAMMVLTNYEIEVTIPESDIVKIKVGQATSVTLDAYGDDVKFTGSIIFIEPAETIIQDVVYYKVKIALDKADYEIKSGMTANVDIETAKREHVLKIPQRAVISNGKKKVKVLENNKIKEVEVQVGLKGEEGMVEITGGDLKEGDEVVTYEQK